MDVAQRHGAGRGWGCHWGVVIAVMLKGRVLLLVLVLGLGMWIWAVVVHGRGWLSGRGRVVWACEKGESAAQATADRSRSEATCAPVRCGRDLRGQGECCRARRQAGASVWARGVSLRRVHQTEHRSLCRSARPVRPLRPLVPRDERGDSP